MQTILKEARPAIVLVVVFTLLLGLAYPLSMAGVAQVVFPDKAGGSLIRNSEGEVIGSELIGQDFSDPKYFWGRPSAAGEGYDATASSGSNLGPTSQKLRDLAEERATALRQPHGLPDDAEVPAELVTASASGLDPHISPEAARFQAERVAAARGLSVDEVLGRIDEHTEGRMLGLVGDEKVNVVELNIALDEADR